MKTAILFTSSGPIVIVTCCDSLRDPRLIHRLSSKGVDKFIGFEIPIEKVKARYGNHFEIVCEDFYESDDLRVVDYNGNKVLSLFSFEEFGPAVYYQQPAEHPVVG